MNTPAAGFGIACDAEGRLEHVLRDALDLGPLLQPGQPFIDLLDGASREKGHRFLDCIRATSAAFDWEMVMVIRGQLTSLHFAGALVQGRPVIVAATSTGGVSQLQEDLIRINNEQLNQVRELSRAVTRQRVGASPDSGVFNELTKVNNELANVQRELVKKNQELGKLNDLKNQFLGMAAHDLRGPLGQIYSLSDLLLNDPALSAEERAEFLTTISQTSEFLMKLVSELLDISTIESGQLTLEKHPTDLGALVRRTLSVYRHAAERKQIRLQAELRATLPPVGLDAAKIEQVLNNLVDNALKFSPRGARVGVRLTDADTVVRLAVEDEGPGIPEQERERLFRPFSRASVRPTAGEPTTGLGLAICRRIVQGHGGRIWIESEVGRGTTFHVELPR